MEKIVENMRVGAIIQARMGSTRLPGKVLKNLIDRPMLGHIVNRLSNAKSIHKIIVATTNLPEDDVIEAYCRSNSVLFYRGHPENVLSRYFEAAKKHNIDIIVRITADCPLIDPQIVDRMVEAFFKLNVLRVFDYLSNTIQRTFPRGLDAEIFLFTTLKKAFYQASSDYEREHVTPFIYEHSKWFKTKNYVEQGQKDYSSHRWTVDTIEDFNLIEEIYKALYSQKKLFLLEDVIKLFSERPELMKINEEVQQKDLGE